MEEYICEKVVAGYDTTGEEARPIVRFASPRERITRCRNCRYGYKGGMLCTYFATQDDDELTIMPAIVEPDGFCAWGEGCDA